MTITIVIADDHSVVRQGLQDFLQTDPALQVVATATNGGEAVEMVARHHPEVVVMGIMMPVMSGLEATAGYKPRVP